MNKYQFESRVKSIVTNEELSISEKLDAFAVLASKLGYKTSSRSETQVEMIRKKKFSFGWAFIFVIFGFLIYWIFFIFVFLQLLFYLSKKDDLAIFNKNGVVSDI